MQTKRTNIMRRPRAIAALLPLFATLSCGDPEVGPPGQMGAPGPKGDPGPVGTLPPQLIGVLPGNAFAERSFVLQVSGLLTHFSASTTVRFDDPEITVQKVTVQSPGYLLAQVQSGKNVRLGAHDITVESAAVDPSGQPMAGREVVQLHGALVLSGTLAADSSGNSKSVEQGGVVDVNLRNVDKDSTLGSSVRIDGGVLGLYVSSLGGRMVGYGIVDALAQPGPLLLHAQSESLLQKTGFTLEPSGATVPQVTARTPTALTIGSALTGEKLSAGKQSNLYKISTTSDAQILVLTFAVEGGLLSSPLLGAVAPRNGRFTDGQLFYVSTNLTSHTALAYLPQKGDSYVAALATTLPGGGSYSITAKTAKVTAQSLQEPMPSDTATMPLADISLDGPRIGTAAAIDIAGDVDYIRIKPAKTGRLYVQAVTPGQSLSPATVSVAILAADCTTQVAPLRPVAQEAAVMSGQAYCVVVASPTGYIGSYQLLASQEL